MELLTALLMFKALFLREIVGTVPWRNSSCGVDRAGASTVEDGEVPLQTYPWMGVLYYPSASEPRLKTAVVLVTRQLALATAADIHNIPKTHFRSRARVVLGRRGAAVRVREYTYHPEYYSRTAGSLALLQLDTDHVDFELRPICLPPDRAVQAEMFAMTIDDNYKEPKVRLYRMEYVNMDQCRHFYRRYGLNQASLWPAHAACARAVRRARCVWRAGAVLAARHGARWRLLGVGVSGPGCGSPARFVQTAPYGGWVRGAGRPGPALTTLADDHLVLRRSLSKIQRYGPCDPEERAIELYTDRVAIVHKPGKYSAKYNVSIFSDVEYSCVVFRARTLDPQDYEAASLSPPPLDRQGTYNIKRNTPKIRLRRWCAASAGLCHGFQNIQIDFHVDIEFSQSVEFTVLAYGKEAYAISPAVAMKYANVNKGTYPDIQAYDEILEILTTEKFKVENKWFYNATRVPTTTVKPKLRNLRMYV